MELLFIRGVYCLLKSHYKNQNGKGGIKTRLDIFSKRNYVNITILF